MTAGDDKRGKIARALRRLHAYHLIQNNMARVLIAINHSEADRMLEQFALEDDRVSLEFADEGVFNGCKAVECIVGEVVGGDRLAGEMIDLHLTTPIIEVAEDDQSARGVWWCPGAGAIMREEGPQAIWVWGMIATNWLSVGDDWKILNFHYFRYIKCSYEKGWVEDTSMINRLNKPMHPLASAGTYHNPYSPLSIRVGIPAAPRPYSTYDGNAWMTSQDKSR